MARSTWKTLMFTAAIGAAAVAGVALAAGSGMSGGGGGGSLQATAPSFDPAEEYRKGAEAYKAGDFKGAESHFSRVTEAAPRNADVWLVLGMARTGKGDLKGAKGAYEKSVKYNPDNIPAHQALGVTLAKLNMADKAKAELEVLQQKATACADTCPQAASIKEAVAAVQGAVATQPTPSARLEAPPSLLFASPDEGDQAYVQAVSLINDHRYDEALASLNRAEQVFGPHPDLLTYLGYTYRKMGQLDRAEGYYRQALAVAPGHRGATEYYGELKVERGDLAGARRMLAVLDRQCAFGCAEAETLRAWIIKGADPGL